MLHILFTILKIIGIIIGILLAFLIILLLLTVFLPVQYRLDAEKYEDFKIGGRISWLFRIFVFSIQYQREEITTRFCIFGIPLKWKSPEEREKKRRKKAFRKEEEGRPDPPFQTEKEPEEKTAVLEKGPPEGSKEENPPEQAESEKKEQTDFKTPEEPLSDEKATVLEKCRHAFRTGKEKAEKLPGKIQKKFRKIQYTFQNFCDKIGDIRNKIEEIKELLNDENNIAAFLLCKDQLFILLRHIAPRKKKGKIEFGFEDPADTGYVLGCISILYAAIGEQVQIYPNFEEEVLEGELMLRGRLQLFVVLKAAWKLYRDKNLKQLYKKFKS